MFRWLSFFLLQQPPGVVTQLVNVCTNDHAEKLRLVKELLDSFGGEGGGTGCAASEIVSGQEESRNDKYLCGDCAVLLQDEMERMISECELDCQAYQQALVKLEKTSPGGGGQQGAMSQAHFEREMAKCRSEEAEEEKKILDLERQLSQLDEERTEQKQQSGRDQTEHGCEDAPG